MIHLKKIGIKYNLGIDRNYSFKQYFIDFFSGKKREKKEFWALKNINIDIKKGEVIGLVGPNGAGKSTLLKVVAKVLKPTEGEITINGKVSPMIELGAGFDMDLTAKENIFLNASVLGYAENFILEKYNDIVEFSELQEFIEVPLRNYSSGMVARLAFSIATIVNPEILIVDEILSVGDLSFQQKSEKKMLEMIQGGTTVLYVSHSIESIENICTKVIWIDKGKIVKIGNPKEICAEYHKSQTEK